MAPAITKPQITPTSLVTFQEPPKQTLKKTLGKDESTGKEEELFGIGIGPNLMRDLIDGSEDKQFRVDMSSSIYDSVSAPDSPSSLDQTEGQMKLFTQAITNMASLQIETEEKVAVDSNWKSSKRISLNAIKSKEKLQ